MEEQIPPTAGALEEALGLAADIVSDIELSRVSLASAALKAGRLARLLNMFEAQRTFEYEVRGYPSSPDGLTREVWRHANLAGRVRTHRDAKTKEDSQRAYLESIEQLESMVEVSKLALQAAADRAVSVSSANPTQNVSAGLGNQRERTDLRMVITEATKKIASRRFLIHEFATRRYNELKFSGIAQDVFATVREEVDADIGDLVPEAVQKFSAVHDNLRSDNPEDWSNAVHSCRRILQVLADAVYPPHSEPRVSLGGKTVKVGQDAYINRLVCFAEDSSDSERFLHLVGSHLSFLGDRLDSVFQAAQKGSHSVVEKAEANRYVVYTYMVVGDILSLRREEEKDAGQPVVEPGVG